MTKVKVVGGGGFRNWSSYYYENIERLKSFTDKWLNMRTFTFGSL